MATDREIAAQALSGKERMEWYFIQRNKEALRALKAGLASNTSESAEGQSVSKAYQINGTVRFEDLDLGYLPPPLLDRPFGAR